MAEDDSDNIKYLKNHFFASQKLDIFAQSDDLNETLIGLDDEHAGERKSVSTAILLSLAVPGLGEAYVGRYSRAAGFFVAEAAIWSSFIYFKHKESWLEDDYINFAMQHAGIDTDDKTGHFFDMLAFYENRDEYNKNSLVYNRDNPFFPEVPEWDWQWSSLEKRLEYRDIKNSSKSQGRNANYSLGLALANRVISAIDAWWSAKSYNRQFSPILGKMHFRLTPSLMDVALGDDNPGFMITFKHKF